MSGMQTYGSYPEPVHAARPVKGLGIATIVLVALQIPASILVIMRVLDQRNFLDRIVNAPSTVSLSEAQRLDDQAGVAAGIALVLYAATAIVWIIWFYRLRCNVEAWRPLSQRRSKGWAIGGWICPIVNFWFPFMMTKDILADTERTPEEFSHERPRSLLVGAWWAFYVASGLITVYGWHLGPATIDSLRSETTASMATYVLRIVAALFAIAVVRKLTLAQDHRIDVEAKRLPRATSSAA